MATVNIQSVSKTFGQHQVLEDVSLKIEKGEFVVVVGSSGCGKSTLLRVIAGLESVDRGSILINDQCVTQTPAAARDIAMVFQNYALYPHMTVYDNMAYALKMRKMNKASIRERVEMAAALLQLTDCLQRKPNALSGGQRQRVAMGRAIVRKPAVFLFDEPLSNLDSKLRTDMRHEIMKLHQQLKSTCIYVTHDQTEAMTMADRIVVLERGRVEQVGHPRELYHHPNSRFVASFLGHYSMNFIPATLNQEKRRLILATGSELPMPTLIRDVPDPISLVVGIRPEHIQFGTETDNEQFSGRIEFIDDMGSDKLVRLVTDQGNVRLSVRVIDGRLTTDSDSCLMTVDTRQASLFCGMSGQRLGGWDA